MILSLEESRNGVGSSQPGFVFPLKWLKLQGGGEASVNSVCCSIQLRWRVKVQSGFNRWSGGGGNCERDISLHYQRLGGHSQGSSGGTP